MAAEACVARAPLTKWVARCRHGGSRAFEDRSSAPTTLPTRLPVEMIKLIDTAAEERILRAQNHARIGRLWAHLPGRDCLALAALTGNFPAERNGPSGENDRYTGPVAACFPGHMIHLDVKKVGKTPNGGEWRDRGGDFTAGLASTRGACRRVGCGTETPFGTAASGRLRARSCD